MSVQSLWSNMVRRRWEGTKRKRIWKRRKQIRVSAFHNRSFIDMRSEVMCFGVCGYGANKGHLSPQKRELPEFYIWNTIFDGKEQENSETVRHFQWKEGLWTSPLPPLNQKSAKRSIWMLCCSEIVDKNSWKLLVHNCLLTLMEVCASTKLLWCGFIRFLRCIIAIIRQH